MTIIYTVLSLLGSLASIVGIPLALFQVRQAKNAARKSEKASLQAKAEVEKFRNELRLISGIVDLEKALSLMDDINIHPSLDFRSRS
jgi:hypothetical protein